MAATLAASDARVDEGSVTCPERGFTLVTSRNHDDLTTFTAAAITVFA